MIFFRSFVVTEVKNSCFYNQLRFVPRWSSRIPKKIHYPEGVVVENTQDEPDQNSLNRSVSKKIDCPTSYSFKAKQRRNQQEVLTIRKVKKKENTPTDMLETIIDADGNIIYTKMKDHDSRIAKILSNLKFENKLNKNESFFIEGKRIMKEALLSSCKLQYILFSKKSDLEELKPYLPKLGANIYKMPYNEMQLWSNLKTNPGIMGVFKIPGPRPVKYDLPINVICDNIREPGNLGTMLRTCAAVSCKSVILTKGCCNIWNSKVLRGGMGAHFKLNMVKLDWKQIKENLSRTHFLIADNNVVKTSNTSSTIVDVVNKIPIESYDLLKYSSESEISLIIGGETEGISQEAYDLVEALGGIRIRIPLMNDIDSLNCGTALGVLLYEMRSQIKNK